MSEQKDTHSDTGREADGPLYGLLAEYENPGKLIDGAKAVRDSGFTQWDCYSPFPVHGIDPAMGVRRTRLPWIVFAGGLSGCGLGLLLQWWANDFHWPWIVSGKPFFSLPANIPITFEATVLIAALTTFFAMWGLNKLPKPWHPFFRNRRFAKVTSNGFFIGVEAADPKFDEEKTRALLEESGATVVEPCHIDPDPRKKRIPTKLVGFMVITVVLAMLPFALIARARASKSTKPHIHVIPDMDFQMKNKSQTRTPNFPDQRADRLPAAGTVARDELRDDSHFYRGILETRVRTVAVDENGQESVTETTQSSWAETFPDNPRFSPSRESMERGRDRFNIYCQPCHGAAAYGDGMVHQRSLKVPSDGWTQPSDLHLATIVGQPHGQIFNTISNGIRTMRGYAEQIPPEDRWAIILYLRALQRSQAASIDDVPPDRRGGIR